MPTKRQSLKREANQNRPALAFCPSGQRPACQLYFRFPYPYFYQFAVNWQTRTVQHFVRCGNPKLDTLTAHCSRILRTFFDAADRFAVRLKVKGLDDGYCGVHFSKLSTKLFGIAKNNCVWVISGCLKAIIALVTEHQRAANKTAA